MPEQLLSIVTPHTNGGRRRVSLLSVFIMLAWVQVEVNELPEFANRKRYTTCKLPDGQVWVPNNMFLDGDPTHWMKLDDHLDQLERQLDRDEYR